MALSPAQIAHVYETFDLLRETQPNDTATFHAVAKRLQIGYATVFRYIRARQTEEMAENFAEIHVPATERTPRVDVKMFTHGVPEMSADYEVDATVGSPNETYGNAYAPQGFIKGESVCLDKKGEVVLKWIKTENKLTDIWAREAAKALAEDLPKVVVEPATDAVSYRGQLVLIPFGDPHLGLHSWAEETGADFDLKIAERDLCEAVQRLVNATEPSEECLIANLGDFFHADNMDGETWRGKNRLDTDTRWAKVLRVGIKAMRYCIEAAAKRHKKVTVINAIGNHDDHSSIFLSVCLGHIYEDNDRIEIIDKPTVTHYYRYYNNLIGVHHGHEIKMANLPLEMAAARKEDWGATENRYWYTGHIHNDSKKEIGGVIVESFRTLAARDAWAAGKGYRSGRDMKAIVLHPQWGEVERHTVSVAMLEYARRIENETD